MKAAQGPHDQPSRCMIMACCNHQRQVRHPQTNTKKTMVQNLQLLFDHIPTATIDRYSSLKDRIKVASNEKYWTELVHCLLHSGALSLSNRQRPAAASGSFLHLLCPPMTGPTMTWTLSSPQHHCKDTFLPSQFQQPQFTVQPSATPPVLDPPKWINDPVLAFIVGCSMYHALQFLGHGHGASKTR
jgi:hypothetical protein